MTTRSEVVPTRSALRELEAELRVVREGREFLDQKRMLLAAEILRRLREYEEALRALDALRERARLALAEAVARHGLEGLLAQPVALSDGSLELDRDTFLGVPVASTRLLWRGDPAPPHPPASPSPEARRCRALHRELLERASALAGQASSLRRLEREYRKTERRTRALEDVLEPELDETVRHVRDELDEQDLDEAVRARHRAAPR